MQICAHRVALCHCTAHARGNSAAIVDWARDAQTYRCVICKTATNQIVLKAQEASQLDLWLKGGFRVFYCVLYGGHLVLGRDHIWVIAHSLGLGGCYIATDTWKAWQLRQILGLVTDNICILSTGAKKISLRIRKATASLRQTCFGQCNISSCNLSNVKAVFGCAKLLRQKAQIVLTQGHKFG